MYIRRFEDTDEQNVDALLGSLNLGIKNKWLIGKESRSDTGKLSFALKHITIEPQKIYPVRQCGYAEAIVVMNGTGIIKNGKDEFEIKPGDVAIISPGEMYSIKNPGETDLRTLCCMDLLS